MTDSVCRWHHWWLVNDRSLHIPFPPLYYYRSCHAASDGIPRRGKPIVKTWRWHLKAMWGGERTRQNMRDNISRGIKWRNIIWTRNHERKPISGNSMGRVKYLIDDIEKTLALKQTAISTTTLSFVLNLLHCIVTVKDV